VPGLLNLSRLELLRLHTDLVWCYKIVFSLVDVHIMGNFFVMTLEIMTFIHEYKLYTTQSTGVRGSVFCERLNV